MNQQAYPPGGGPVQPPPLTAAPSATPGAIPFPNGVHLNGVAAPAPSQSSSEGSGAFDLERFGRVDEREVSMALNGIASSASDGGAAFEMAVLGPSGLAPPDGTPVEGPPPSPAPSAIAVFLGHVNRALESQNNADEDHTNGVNGFISNGSVVEEGEGEGDTMGWETLRFSAGTVEDVPVGEGAEYLGLGSPTEDGVADLSDSVLFPNGAPDLLASQAGGARTLQPRLQGGTRNTLLDSENRPVFPPTQQRVHRVNGYDTNRVREATATATTSTVATTTGATNGTSSLSTPGSAPNPYASLPFRLLPRERAQDIQAAHRFFGLEDQTFLDNYPDVGSSNRSSTVTRPLRTHRRIVSNAEDENFDISSGPRSPISPRNPSLTDLMGDPGPSTSTWRDALLRPVRAVSDTVHSTRIRVHHPHPDHHQSFGMTRLDSEPRFFPPPDNSIQRIRNRARRNRMTPPPGLLFGNIDHANKMTFVT
ncbi:hypothetical protein B0T16DRAFT_452735 [Cercophora newfieldiana]|uniref:Uncharacterized protein n=1 Tax=Cercophora newfieldiana TaxID=92897 RepID=A0AA39YT95_9PEZI|nr:hypothetical protein B0T16DRAFT_452735 [Cercophora newfieldiana]